MATGLHRRERIYETIAYAMWETPYDELGTAQVHEAYRITDLILAAVVVADNETDDGAAVAAQSMGGSLPPAVPSSPSGPGSADVIGGQPGPVARRFELYRHTDVSNVSGTGVVAEGCEFTDGSVALRWLGLHPSTAVWPSVAEVLAVHGHQGATEIRWIDDRPIELWPAEGGPDAD